MHFTQLSRGSTLTGSGNHNRRMLIRVMMRNRPVKVVLNKNERATGWKAICVYVCESNTACVNESTVFGTGSPFPWLEAINTASATADTVARFKIAAS